jgi:hypothetical protein
LTLALERGALVADTPDDRHVAIHAKDLVAAERALVVGLSYPLTFGRKQLNKFFVDHRLSFGLCA